MTCLGSYDELESRSVSHCSVGLHGGQRGKRGRPEEQTAGKLEQTLLRCSSSRDRRQPLYPGPRHTGSRRRRPL